jgi:peptidoglycan/LPS O-acetylase OafA/YrhL
MESSKSTINYNQQFGALNGLRGLAALIVVLSHTSNVEYFFFPHLNFSGIGKSGVYLFFILSSFLLTLPLLKLGRSIFSRQQIIYYWSRRFFRVYPLYFLYLLAALLSSLVINYIVGPRNWAIPFQLSIAEFFQHIYLQEGKSVTWSIAVEFKYYFILPFVAFILSYILKNNLLKSLILLTGCIIFLTVIQMQVTFENQATDVLKYIPVFLFGTMLAIIQYHLQIKKIDLSKFSFLLRVLELLSLIMLIFMIPSVYSQIVKPVDFDYFANSVLTYSCLWSCLIFSLVNRKSIFSSYLSRKIPCFLGKISFSVYLLHPIFIDLMRHFKFDTAFNAWIVLFGSIFLSYWSFKLVEKPGMDYSSNLTK